MSALLCVPNFSEGRRPEVIGAILGALLFSIVLIPWQGTQVAQQVIIVIAAVSSLVVGFNFLATGLREASEDG